MSDSPTDLELLAHIADETCLAQLAERYRSMCYAVSASFPNLPLEDSVQECSLALIAAAKHFDPTRNVAFGTYAWRCMHNRLCRMARKSRHDRALHVDYEAEEEETQADWMEIQEQLYNERQSVKHKLSPFEYRVYTLFTAGNRQNEIAALLSCEKEPVDVKSINNALGRIRRKLRRQ